MPTLQLPLPFPEITSIHDLPPSTDDYRQCEHCEGECLACDLQEHSNENCCADCLTTCEDCGNVEFTDDDSSTIQPAHTTFRRHSDELPYCNSCSFECDDCNERFAASLDTYLNTGNDRICERCAENYHSCEHCSGIIHADETHSNDDGETLCSSCYEQWRIDNAPDEDQDEDQDEYSRENDKLIHDYSYKPSPRFKLASTQLKSAIYFGCELEVDEGGESESNVSACGLADDDAFYCKHDGSIGNGFEIVSHPASWEFWNAHSLDFMPALSKLKYKSYETTTCGMHVHVSRSYLSDFDVFKLVSFVRGNRDFIFKVSRRKRENLDRWSQLDEGSNAKLIRKVKNGNDERYHAINLQNKKTVEFRIFRGTLDVESFKRNLAFVYCLCAFVKQSGLKQLTQGHFNEWVQAHASRYIGRGNVVKSLKQWISSL